MTSYEKYHTLIYGIHKRRPGWGDNLRLQSLEENDGDVIMATNDLLINRPWKMLDRELSQHENLFLHRTYFNTLTKLTGKRIQLMHH